MASTWTPAPISRATLPVRYRSTVLVTWEGKPGRANGRDQATYLSRNGQLPLISMGGAVVDRSYAFGVGQRYGQRRVVLSPSCSDGLDWHRFVPALATKWGLDDAGWYAAVHFDTDAPHAHIIAETESPWGDKVILTDTVLQAWKTHAEDLLTRVLGPQTNAA
jgi:hypothetical protein